LRSSYRKEQEPTRPQAPGTASLEAYRYDATLGHTELLWKCLRCGELMPRKGKVLDSCPSCLAPKTEFVLVDED
jgi:rubrerythrin